MTKITTICSLCGGNNLRPLHFRELKGKKDVRWVRIQKSFWCPSCNNVVNVNKPIITKTWAMPNKWTFEIKPIREIINTYIGDFGEDWVDPFSGYNSPAMIKNDLDKGAAADMNMDALEFLQSLPDESAAGVIYDPPYSITQARGYGSKKYSNMRYWSDCKNEIQRIVKPGGRVICFGWNSGGLGKNRGFTMERIYLIAHGGTRNDTICTIEIKRGVQQLPSV